MSMTLPLPAGAAKIGDLNTLSDEDRFVVSLFRGAPEARKDSDIARVSGQLLSILHTHSRRRFQFHGSQCDCLGADEAIFVEFVKRAAAGEREDATLMVLLMIEAGVAPLAVSLAEQLGLLIRTLVRVEAISVPYH